MLVLQEEISLLLAGRNFKARSEVNTCPKNSYDQKSDIPRKEKQKVIISEGKGKSFALLHKVSKIESTTKLNCAGNFRCCQQS